MASQKSVHFENPVYASEESDDEADAMSFSSAMFPDASRYEEDEVSDDGVSFMSMFHTADGEYDASQLNPGKVINFTSYYRLGPAPPSDGNLDGSACLPIGSLDRTADTDKKDETLDPKYSPAACHALLSYFVQLAESGEYAKVDFKYVTNLLTSAEAEGVANINFTDPYGQSLMHQVARDWNVDVASFLLHSGADIDIADDFGRTPLFVAAASDYVEMVQWLLDHGANMNHKTIKGEGQLPIHYCAKYNATKVLQFLAERGADLTARDDRERTPLFLSAEYACSEASRFLLAQELPVCAYSSTGESCLTKIVQNLSTDLAYQALDQIVYIDKPRKKTFYYLGNLENKFSRMMLASRGISVVHSKAKTPLEIICESGNLSLITHPAILQVIAMKSRMFGERQTMLSVIVYAVFVVLWTISIAMFKEVKPRTFDRYFYGSIVTQILGQFLASFFAVQLFQDYQRTKKELVDYKIWKEKEIQDARKFCHPRWQIEENYCVREEEGLLALNMGSWWDGWRIIECVTFVCVTIYCILTIAWLANPDSKSLYELKMYYSCVLVVLVWLSLNRSLMFLQTLGPFINILASSLETVVQFGFLFFEFFVPFVIMCWVMFGQERPENADSDLNQLHDLMYQVFLMTLVYDYNYDGMEKVDKYMAQIVAGLYLLLVSCICINLYIAMLSEAFVRLYSVASATAYINEAKKYLTFERKDPLLKLIFEEYVFNECSPQVVDGLVTDKWEGKKEMLQRAKTAVDTQINELTVLQKEMAQLQLSLRKVQDEVSVFNKEKVEEISSLENAAAEIEKRSYSKLPLALTSSLWSHIPKNSLDTDILDIMSRSIKELSSDTLSAIRNLVSGFSSMNESPAAIAAPPNDDQA